MSKEVPFKFPISDRVKRALDCLTDARREKILSCLENRMTTVHVILDNVDDPGNRSAIFRSADAFGLFYFHLINKRKPRKVSPYVSMKVEKWLSILTYKSVDEFLSANIFENAQFWESQMNSQSQPLKELIKVSDPMRVPVFLIFGNEHEGTGQEWASVQPQTFWLPMRGFSESFNVSVAAALTFYQVSEWQRQAHQGKTGLSSLVKSEVLQHWLT